LCAGGVSETNKINELIKSTSHWPSDCILIIKAKNSNPLLERKITETQKFKNIIFCNDYFSPDELHSLIKYCNGSICLYKNESENIYYLGKSSGKIMRSIALGKPVIATKFPSLEFIEEFGIGKLVENENDIGNAIKYLIENSNYLENNCVNSYHKISFERYWKIIEKRIIQ
jgi:glycosyltransferase involved in cell wall biosynthesis